MTSTLQKIFTQIAALPFPPDRIHYGLCDTLSVKDGPMIVLSDFKRIPTYQTNGVAFTESTFTLHVFAVKLEDAENVAAQIDSGVILSGFTSPQMAVYQESYEVFVEGDIKDFFSHVALSYKLEEST